MNTRRDTITKGTTRRDDTLPCNGDTLPTAATEELSERSEQASVSPPPCPPSAAASPTTARSAVLGSPRPLPAARRTPPRPVPTFKLVKCSLLARASPLTPLSLSFNYALRINAFRGIFVAADLKVTVCDCVIPARSSPRDDTRYVLDLDDWLSNNPSRVDNPARWKFYTLNSTHSRANGRRILETSTILWDVV